MRKILLYPIKVIAQLDSHEALNLAKQPLIIECELLA